MNNMNNSSSNSHHPSTGTPSVLRTSATAAVADPVTKRHVQKMADATALALATSSGKHSTSFKKHLQNLENEDRTFGFKRQKEQLDHGSHRYKESELIQTETMSNNNNQAKFNFQTKVSKNLLDDSSLILNPQFLGNVAAQYQPPAPPPFVPVAVITSKTHSRSSSSKRKKRNNNNTATSTSGGSELDNNNNSHDQNQKTPAIATLPAAIETSIPPLDTAAPARNLCIELLATRVVSCVKAMSLLLQEHSSSPGQSLPHVAVLGAGNVGQTVLTHLVKLLPADRIVILARDAKSEVCNNFSTKYGVRALSTNILKDERLVDVIKSHRNKIVEDALKRQKDAGLISGGSDTHQQKKQPFFGGSSSSSSNQQQAAASALFAGDQQDSNSGSSHVAPEVAAAQNISIALQQVHVLIVCCRPAQLSEVAASLQPWLRSSSVVVLSTLAGVTADRVAALFRVPSSLSVTVDTNDMLFDFETRSRLHARAQENATAAAKLIGNLNNNNNNKNNSNPDSSLTDAQNQGLFLESSLRSTTTSGRNNNAASVGSQSTSVVGALLNMNRAEQAGLTSSRKNQSGGGGENKNNNQNEESSSTSPNINTNTLDSSNSYDDLNRSLALLEHQQHQAQHQQNQLRFFTREPLDFLHRLFFSLVSTLLERCGVGPQEAWVAVAKLFLGPNTIKSNNILKKREGFSIVQGSTIQMPRGVGAQGPTLVSKCSVQILAQGAGVSVGEALRIIDERMVRFAGF